MACTFFIGASQTNVKAISCRKSSYSCYRRRFRLMKIAAYRKTGNQTQLVAIPEITQTVKLAQRNVMRRNYISRRRMETLHYARKRTSLVIFFKLLSRPFIRKKQSSFLFICRARARARQDSFSRSEWHVKLEGNVS